MSTLASLWALRRCAALSLPATEAALLMALADWTQPDGHCQPPVAALARSAGLGRSTVASVGAKLKARGLVRRTVPGPTEATVWTLAVDEPFEVVPDDAGAETGQPLDAGMPETSARRGAEGAESVVAATPAKGGGWEGHFQSALGGVDDFALPNAEFFRKQFLQQPVCVGVDLAAGPSVSVVHPPRPDSVARILAALDLPEDLRQPLFWQRREHREDLALVLRVTGLTVDQLAARCEALRDVRPDRMRSLRGLIPLLEGVR